MKINLGNIRFVRKDRTLFSNPFKTIMEETKTKFVYVDNKAGVAVIPYRMGKNGKEILIRDEFTPLHDTVLSIITGRKDPDDKNNQAAARRELLEEAGILAEERWFTEIGELFAGGDQKNKDALFIVDVTGVHQGKPSTDGSIFEKKSTNMWVPVSDLVRMVREPHNMDAYLLAAITTFLSWCGMIGKSEETDLEKSKKGSEKPGHKYIRRKNKPTGGYQYIYKEPEAKGSKKDDKGKKPTLVEQLAALVGKKQGSEEEKKPKKQFPWDEFNTVPEGMPDFKKGMSAAQWLNSISYMVTNTVNSQISELDDADHDLLNNPDKTDSLNVDVAIKILETTRGAYSSTETAKDDLVIENKKLDDVAQREVKGAIMTASHALAIVNHMTQVLNSSIVENVFENFSAKIASDKFRPSQYKKLDKLSGIAAIVKNNLETLNESMQDITWLQGSDPKLDWMVDKVFEATDELMKSRNRYAKNGLKFFIDQMTPKLESLKDAEEIEHSMKMLEQFEIFIDEVIYSSTTARTLGVFANQWNMKQKGIYDGACRFSAYASGKIVDKIKSLENLGDDIIVKNYINETTKNDAFSFINMGHSQEPFRLSEQVFSYIDMHGLDKYYQDSVFLTGGRRHEDDTYKGYVETLTKAYEGRDVYHDDDALFQSEKARGGIGSMAKGRHAALYTAMNTMILMNKNAPIESKIPAFVRMWSMSSHNSLMSNAVEAFVEDRGIDRASYVNYHIASNRTMTPRRTMTKDALSDTVNKIYENTQKELSYYIRKPVRLFRGNGSNEIKSAVSSWTSQEHIAINFGHIVSKIDAPVESIFLAFNEENEDYWNYPQEREYVIVPGLLSADKKINPEQLAPEEKQKILDRQLEKEAEAYGESY